MILQPQVAGNAAVKGREIMTRFTKLPPTKVGGLAHSVLMAKVINIAPSSARMRQHMKIKVTV